MPRTEVYSLYLTKKEKDQLAFRAKIEGCSIAKLIRWRLGLDVRDEQYEKGTSSGISQNELPHRQEAQEGQVSEIRGA